MIKINAIEYEVIRIQAKLQEKIPCNKTSWKQIAICCIAIKLSANQ